MDISSFAKDAQQHPAAASMYVRHGWKLVQIPFGQKGPAIREWNTPGNWITETDSLPPTFNMGLLHAFSGTMSFDIDQWDATKALLAEEGIDLDKLYTAHDAVTIESGKAGHGKLLYAMPFGTSLPSKKIVRNGEVVFELRCATASGKTVQDVLPPSRHPETGQLYQWGGNGRWDNLPVIPVELIDYWQRQLTPPEPIKIPTVAPTNTPDEIRSALWSISPDCSRDEWRDVGMGLHHQGHMDDTRAEMFELWDDWSAQSATKYPGREEMLKQWDSFKIVDNGITIATLYDLAYKAGWVRPIPSVEHLFKKETPLDVFHSMRPPPPDVDLSIIPEPLASRAQAISKSVGCDPIGPLFAGLGVVCAAADSRIRLKLAEGYEVPPILWLASIGAPSDKKSPGTRPMFSILHELEAEDKPNWRRRHNEWKVKNELSKRQWAAYLEHSVEHLMHGTEDTDNTVQQEVTEAPPEPKPKLLMVQDITSQKLLHHGAANPGGLLCYLDEMKGWTDQLTNKHSQENRSTWIAGYEGGRARMDRVGAGEIFADPFSVSIFGNIQPDVWREKVGLLSSDGFISRFIVATLRARYTSLGEPMSDSVTFRQEYEQMIRMIYALPVQTYTLTTEAWKVFRTHQKWTIDRGMQDRFLENSGVNKSFSYAFHKGDGTVGRLALVFHLMTEPFMPGVSAETMQRAVDFFQGYVVQALRYAYWEMGDQTVNSLDVWMATHILAHSDKESVSLRELKRSARRQLTAFPSHHHDAAIMDAILPLESCHWVALVDADRKNNSYRWVINPELKTMFADYRKQVLTIKQRRLDEMQTVAQKHRPGQDVTRRMVPGYDPSWDD